MKRTPHYFSDIWGDWKPCLPLEGAQMKPSAKAIEAAHHVQIAAWAGADMRLILEAAYQIDVDPLLEELDDYKNVADELDAALDQRLKQSESKKPWQERRHPSNRVHDLLAEKEKRIDELGLTERKAGNSKLVYDKQSHTIIGVSERTKILEHHIAELQAENKRLQALYDKLLLDSIDLGKKVSVPLHERIAELEAELRTQQDECSRFHRPA
jgi:exonuclease VII large subunit